MHEITLFSSVSRISRILSTARVVAVLHRAVRFFPIADSLPPLSRRSSCDNCTVSSVNDTTAALIRNETDIIFARATRIECRCRVEGRCLNAEWKFHGRHRKIGVNLGDRRESIVPHDTVKVSLSAF